ncbi:MAG: hypothetical protein JRI70_06525 [Deltaproteobacteria bacterium]|nr:hypothetical protein [Deltaproteobacteria bacterium]MBW2170484.1 hypothetical protein [Deltaproteobacteria bacterium]MBW2259790.1 hypothetical protein [Deltaproteobacteria bacterium]
MWIRAQGKLKIPRLPSGTRDGEKAESRYKRDELEDFELARNAAMGP